MLRRLAVLSIFVAAGACSADPHQAGTPAAPASTASGAATLSASAAAAAPSKETETGIPAAYAKICTGTLKVEMTIMRAEGAGEFGGYAEKAPAGTKFLLGAGSYDYTGYFVTSDGVWAKLAAQSEKLEPNVTFTSTCVPKTLPKLEEMSHVALGKSTLFASQDLKGTGCILDGGTVMTGYGYMALGNSTATVWSNEAKAKCGCEKCYSRDIHVEYLIPLGP